MALLSPEWIVQGYCGWLHDITRNQAPFDFLLCHSNPLVLKMAVRAPAIVFSFPARRRNCREKRRHMAAVLILNTAFLDFPFNDLHLTDKDHLKYPQS